MKRTVLILAAALLWVVPASADEIVRSFRQQIPVGTADRVVLDFPVGEVLVEGGEGSQVDLDVKIACDRPTNRCEEAAKKLRLVYDNSGGNVKVEVKDWPKLSGTKGLRVIANVRMPRDLALTADLGVGELQVRGVQGSVQADLGVGEVDINLSKESFGNVSLDTGVGEASLVVAGRRYSSSGLVARELHWNKGTGSSDITVDCGVGEINVRLE